LKSRILIKVDNLSVTGGSLEFWNKDSAILLLVYWSIRST